MIIGDDCHYAREVAAGQACQSRQPVARGGPSLGLEASCPYTFYPQRCDKTFPVFLPKFSPLWRPQVGIESLSEMANIFPVFLNRALQGLWCDLGFFPNSHGNKAAANLRPRPKIFPVSDTLLSQFPIPFLFTFPIHFLSSFRYTFDTCF